jgi:hypothetical protein
MSMGKLKNIGKKFSWKKFGLQTTYIESKYYRIKE